MGAGVTAGRTGYSAGMHARLPLYSLALLMGLVTCLAVLPLATLAGDGPGWAGPGADQAQTLSGHLAFQADIWRWPLLSTERLFWPHMVSIALIDSNPLVSVLAKVWTHWRGVAPVNWLGAFLGVCWFMQPVAGVYAARGLRVGAVGCLVAGVLAACWPALMVRMGHINLCAHFLLLLALGMTFRLMRGGPSIRRWAAPSGLLLLAVFTHPYLFQLCAVVLAAIPLQAALRRRTGWWRDASGFVLSGVLAVGVLTILSGPIGGGDKGFTFFSMNLLSPVVPQLSGVFGMRPVIDATGGQYEGYNWLGAGTMLLLGAALIGIVGRWTPRPALALVLVLAALTLVSLSSQVWAGPVKLLDLGTKPWEDIFGSFRSSGRAFWPVGYAVMLGCVAAADRLPRAVGWPLLLAAAALQLVDIQPLAVRGRGVWNAGSSIAAPAVPPGTTLFTVAPHPGCAPDPATKARGPLMLLDAVRHGAIIGDIGLGRSPRWFSCERILSDALELPLMDREVRAFFGRVPQAALRPALLGPGASCRGMQDVIFCGRGVAEADGAPLPPGPALVPHPLPLTVEGLALAPLLGSGWVLDDAGVAWSEGPQSTLLLAVSPGDAVTVHLRLSGITFAGGGSRPVSVLLGRAEARGFVLPDGTEMDVVIPVGGVGGDEGRSGLVRLALDVFRPVEPSRRGFVAPVKRAAIRLYRVSVTAG